MADIIQVEPSQYKINHPDIDMEPQYRDQTVILLVILAVLALVTAVATGIYARFFYDSSTAPIEAQTLVILQAVFGVLAVGLYAAAVWKALNNVSLQARAGCPSCHHHELMRISRHRKDRLMTFGGFKVARYQCRQCRWNGRRIFRTNYHPLSRMELMELDAAYVQPKVVPVSKPASLSLQPESLPFEFEKKAEVVETAAVMDETKVETVDVEPEPPASEMVFVDSGPEETPELLDYSTNDAPTNGGAVPETLTKIQDTAGPVAEDKATEAADAGQDAAPLLSGKAKINTKFGINLKEEPRSDSNWIGLLGSDTIVSLLKSKKMADGTVWYLVKFDDQSGWVESSCLEPAKQVD